MEEMKSEGHTSPSLGKELSALSSAVALHENGLALDEEEESFRGLLEEATTANDKDLEQECLDEIKRIKDLRASLESQIVDAVLPVDNDDYEADAIIEVRAGTGGDEASLFASELLKSYEKTAKTLGWKVESLGRSETDIGGLREGSVSVSGGPSFQLPGDSSAGPLLGPYGAFKFESGVHRVQRVPVNDSRIHTSACSVAVLPSVPQDSTSQELLPMSELKIETMRASGAGGQHVNTTDSAVRITHLPTGITASIQDERSQHKNKAKALQLITARVRDKKRAEEERRLGQTRSSLMGSGDRSERIRTYNFPQDRVTDHRCKESQHGIEVLLNGGKHDGIVSVFLPSLKALQREEALQHLEIGSESSS
jgi:peptide chain release factor 1